MMQFKTFSKGRPCYKAYTKSQFPRGTPYTINHYTNCWRDLYRFPFLDFGVDTIRKVWTLNLDLSNLKWSPMSKKTERLVDLYCKATQHNLIPFYNFYNIHVKDSVAAPCKAQPKPKMLTGYLEIAKCLLDENTSDAECTKIPGWPKYKGLCFLSGTCESNPDKG